MISLRRLFSSSGEALCGVYRGVVTGTVDPLESMRLQVTVPDLGIEAQFAEACLPALSTEVSLPAIGAGVWIAFERGDRNFPVWLGTMSARN
jgi:hypothetical protein